jgi:hypothetical protein
LSAKGEAAAHAHRLGTVQKLELVRFDRRERQLAAGEIVEPA